MRGASSQSEDVDVVGLRNQNFVSGETEPTRSLRTVDNNAGRMKLGVEVQNAVVVAVSDEVFVGVFVDDDVPRPVELVSCVAAAVTAE